MKKDSLQQELGLENSKGFLIGKIIVIVIVIAVVCAILIPTFITLAENNRLNQDLQVARNATKVAQGVGQDASLQDIYNELKKQELDIENLIHEDYVVAYNAYTKNFVLLNQELDAVESMDIEKANICFFVNDISDIYKKEQIQNKKYAITYFLCKDIGQEIVINYPSSINAGDNEIKSNLVLNNVIQNEQVTNSIEINGQFSSNITLDMQNTNVELYGYAQNINLQNFSNGALNVHGRVSSISTQQGNVKILSGAYVKNLTITENAQNVELTNTGYIGNLYCKQLNAQNYKVTNNGYIENCLDIIIEQNSNTIHISNYSQLCNFRDEVNSGNSFYNANILLDANIELEQGWEPIGAYHKNEYNTGENGKASFAGTFDGNNYSIINLSNLTYDFSNENMLGSNAQSIKDMQEFHYGFFGVVTNATIKNIKFINVNIRTPFDKVYGNGVGAVAGYASGNVKLENIEVQGYIQGYDNVAGLIGIVDNVQSVTISNCTNRADVYANVRSGGLVGNVEKASSISSTLKIENSKNYGTILSSLEKVYNHTLVSAGGIIGYITDFNADIVLSKCESNGAIKANFNVENVTTTHVYVGYAVGGSATKDLMDNVKIEDCIFTGALVKIVNGQEM